MARNLSVYRRRPGLVDIIFPARSGAKSYEFFASANWDAAGTSFQVVPATGFRSPGVPDVGMSDGQFRGKTRFLFNPSDYTVGIQVAALVALANQIKLKYNAHAANGGGLWHTVADSTNAPVATADATDQASAITLLNVLRTKYEARRILVGGGPVHPVADTVNALAAPPASDLATAYALSNDLKAKFNAHRTQATVHNVNDTVDVVLLSNGLAMDDALPFYLSIAQTDWDGTVHAAEAIHLVLPYSSAPNRPLVLKGTAPSGTSIADSLEIQLPMQCQNAVFQSTAAASYVAFEPGGPEFRVPAFTAELLDLTVVYPSFSQLFVRGDETGTTLQVVTSLRNNHAG